MPVTEKGTGGRSSSPLGLKLTRVPEWDAEDDVAGLLDGEAPVTASEDEARKMLDQTEFTLPDNIDWHELQNYARTQKTPFDLELPPDGKNYNYYSIRLPLGILLGGKEQITRLRLMLDMEAEGYKPDQVIAYDLFPNDNFDVKTIMTGDASIDISKALKFIPVTAVLSDCLGLKLNVPFQWKSTQLTISTSGYLSHHASWYITDKSIQGGFTGYAIIRAPKPATVKVNAWLIGEIRDAGPTGFLKTHIISDKRSYIHADDNV